MPKKPQAGSKAEQAAPGSRPARKAAPEPGRRAKKAASRPDRATRQKSAPAGNRAEPATRSDRAPRARKAPSRPRPAPRPPAYILWEVSRDCPLGCTFCRHSALPVGTSRDLTTDEGVRFIDSIAKTLPAALHLTGPEPLVRKDLFELSHYASTRGLTVHLATNGATFDVTVARACVESRIRQIELYIDGSSGRIHDGYRGCAGGFTRAIKGLELIRLAGIKFKIAATLTQRNVTELPKILSLAQKLGAIGVNVFFNIPVGRGVHFQDDPVPEEQYLEALNWIFDQEIRHPRYIHLQCSPQYARIYRQRAHELPGHLNPFTPGQEHMVRDHGCPAGREFLFVGHDGHVYPCPYLLVPAGHVLESSLKDIWERGSIFEEIRDPRETGGKCQRCKFLSDCRGCRALAFRKFSEPMQEDPACRYQPEG